MTLMLQRQKTEHLGKKNYYRHAKEGIDMFNNKEIAKRALRRAEKMKSKKKRKRKRLDNGTILYAICGTVLILALALFGKVLSSNDVNTQFWHIPVFGLLF